MICTKIESDSELRRRDLNRLAKERVFTSEQLDEVELYLTETNYKFYNVRDKLHPKGRFGYKLPKDKVLDFCKGYDRFSVFESLAEADDNLVIQGELEITNDFILRGSLSDVKNISNRQAMESPKWNLVNIDLMHGREPSVPHLTDMINYLCEKELIDMVVEFSLFSVPVGIKQENLIIWELRNY